MTPKVEDEDNKNWKDRNYVRDRVMVGTLYIGIELKEIGCEDLDLSRTGYGPV